MERDESNLIDHIKWPILRGVVIGATCGISPSTCPAILAISQAATFAHIVSKISDALISSNERRIVEAESDVVSTIISNAIVDRNKNEIRMISNSIGDGISEFVPPFFGSDSHHIQKIAAQTAFYAIDEGIGGFLSWVVE
jgi:hypothetical protein